jgi:hypothetical protein
VQGVVPETATAVLAWVCVCVSSVSLFEVPICHLQPPYRVELQLRKSYVTAVDCVTLSAKIGTAGWSKLGLTCDRVAQSAVLLLCLVTLGLLRHGYQRVSV